MQRLTGGGLWSAQYREGRKSVQRVHSLKTDILTLWIHLAVKPQSVGLLRNTKGSHTALCLTTLMQEATYPLLHIKLMTDGVLQTAGPKHDLAFFN